MIQPDRQNHAHRLIACASPAGWAWYTNGGRWALFPHLDLIDRVVSAQLEAQRPKGVLIETPPGMGKSEYVRAVAGYILGRWPNKRVIHASHTIDLSRRAGAAVREDLREFGPEIFGITISQDSQAKEHFTIAKHRGSFYGVGVEGALTGRRGEVLLTDDLVKDAEAARSERQRETMRDWLYSVLRTRREPWHVHIGIQTRWHEEDPHGFILRTYPNDYIRLRLPALAEENDPLGRAPGEALCPQRFTREALEQERETNPWWSALYQQNPVPSEGGIFKREWWERSRYTVHEDGTLRSGPGKYSLSGLHKFVTVDLAVSERATADYTVIACFGVTNETPGRALLLDVVRRRMQGPDITPAVAAMLSKWGARAAWYEAVGTQSMSPQYAKREGLPVRTVGRSESCDLRLSGDKVAVANDAAPFLSNGRLLVPVAAPWLADWEAEMLAFPNGAHDDQVDATAWGCLIASEARPSPEPPEVRRKPAWQRPGGTLASPW